ncbi:MAG TPA: tyrosine-type recombinase/integrase, partial [Polyangiaceae bacterium]|nr:tyrosine-type recombinase/integrase [Polyangiaceae bacterium]
GFFSGEPAKERQPYTRTESAVLVSHNLIPWPIRVLTALCIYAGLREGEACGRRWGDIDMGAEPLWSMDVATQYGGRALKTKRPRVVPVHPELAAILEDWGSNGFPDLMGRAPTPEDFMVPYVSARARGGHHTRSTFYKAFVAGCAAAGIPCRSLHSTRHTMITLARRGGARKEVLQRITHNAQGDIVDRYTHLDWQPLCEAVVAIGSLFDARPNAPLGGGSARETGAASDPCGRAIARGLLNSGSGEPTSIPGASTDSVTQRPAHSAGRLVL